MFILALNGKRSRLLSLNGGNGDTSQRLKKRRLHNCRVGFKDLDCYNKGLDAEVLPLCSQDSSHNVKDKSTVAIGMIQILTAVILKLISSGSL